VPLAEALAIDEELAAADPANGPRRTELSRSLQAVALQRLAAGQRDEARARAARALAIRRDLADGSDQVAHRVHLAETLILTGLLADDGAAAWAEAATVLEPLAPHTTDDEFLHVTGHGLGLRYHEPVPLLCPGGDTVLEEGMLHTVEPGVYRADFGGFRIEDNVLVTADGAEVMGGGRDRLTRTATRADYEWGISQSSTILVAARVDRNGQENGETTK
jgi:hypothetical protein